MNLSETISTSTQQRVVILDNDTFDELFDSVSPMRLSVQESKRATKFAVEDGTERSDHIVTALTEMQIDLYLYEETRNSFENLRQAFEEHMLVTVQTKVASYSNMLIVDIPHDETVDLGDAVNVSMRLQQWLAVQPEYGELPPRKVVNPAQSSTVERGQQTTTESVPETEKKTTILDNLFGWLLR